MAWLPLLSALYLAQGLPFGFFTQALPVMMRQQGYELPDIGLASALSAPWALKFLWAPLVDRYGSPRFGRRRSFIVPLQVGAIALLLGLSFLPVSTDLRPLMAAVFVINLLAATQDIATDGLAVGLLRDHERGLGNAVQVAAYRVGMILGGGVLLMAFDDLGWRGTFLAMAGITALCTLPILGHREREVEIPAAPLVSVDWFWRPGQGHWLALLLAYKAGDALASGMVKPLLVDRALDLEDVGFLSGTIGSVMGLLGALLGGFGVNRLGRRRAMVIFGLAQALSVVAYAAAAEWSTLDRLAAATAFEHLAGGAATVSLFTAMMDRCRPHREATDYTVQASLVVFATGSAGCPIRIFCGLPWLSAALCAGGAALSGGRGPGGMGNEGVGDDGTGGYAGCGGSCRAGAGPGLQNRLGRSERSCPVSSILMVRRHFIKECRLFMGYHPSTSGSGAPTSVMAAEPFPRFGARPFLYSHDLAWEGKR